jgi:hypothetical protein
MSLSSEPPLVCLFEKYINFYQTTGCYILQEDKYYIRLGQNPYCVMKLNYLLYFLFSKYSLTHK